MAFGGTIDGKKRKELKTHMIKVIFFDMDGTLFSHRTHRLPESAKRALAQLRLRGIRCVAATGRHIRELLNLVNGDVVFDGFVTLNGQLCWDADQNCIYENPIREPDKSWIIDRFCKNAVPILLLQKDAITLNYVNEHVETVQRDISTDLPMLGTYNGDEIDQVIAYLPCGAEKEIAQRLQESFVFRWHDLAIDIIPKGGDKTVGIAAYLKTNDIAPAEAMAFGDGSNDVSMLRFVGTGVAMGNASDEVKAAADYVTDDVDEDGVEKALKHFGLID